MGGSYRTPVGMIKVTALSQQTIASITGADARGDAASPARLLEYLDGAPTDLVWRVEFQPDGADPRTALRKRASLSDVELADVLARLARLDHAGSS